MNCRKRAEELQEIKAGYLRAGRGQLYMKRATIHKEYKKPVPGRTPQSRALPFVSGRVRTTKAAATAKTDTAVRPVAKPYAPTR